jgi:hypothetical protein
LGVEFRIAQSFNVDMRAFVLFFATLAPAGLFSVAPTNLDFEAAGQLGATPPGWTTFASGAGLSPEGYSF